MDKPDEKSDTLNSISSRDPDSHLLKKKPPSPLERHTNEAYHGPPFIVCNNQEQQPCPIDAAN